MSKERDQVPDLDKLVQTGRKKFVRYAEGAALYSLGFTYLSGGSEGSQCGLQGKALCT